MAATWLADVLKDAGLPFIEMGGWRSRGGGLSSPQGVVIHDTVTGPNWADSRVADMLAYGERGTPDPPLANLGIDRSGRLWVVAAGRANHNGYGRWGNDSIGIEVFCRGGWAGREEPQNAAQQEAGQRASAAILRHLGRSADRCQGHRETDPGRKIDPYAVSMNHYRAEVARLLEGEDELTEHQAQLLTDLHVAMGETREALAILQHEVAEVEIRQRQLKYRDDAILALLRAAYPEHA